MCARSYVRKTLSKKLKILGLTKLSDRRCIVDNYDPILNRNVWILFLRVRRKTVNAMETRVRLAKRLIVEVQVLMRPSDETARWGKGDDAAFDGFL